MRRSIIGGCAVLGLLGAVACGDFFDVGCQADQRPGIALTAVDSITGGPVSGIATARSGTFADTVEVSGGDTFVLADGRPGTYEVEVTAEGYVPWAVSGVLVPESGTGCVLRRIPLTARLQSAEGG